MIRSVEVTNYLGETIVLTLGSPEKSGLLVREITGLGPVEADINTTEMSTSDGSLYNSGRVRQRNIVISLSFMYAPTIEDSRHLSYKFFPVKRKVRLVFNTDSRRIETYGYVESNSASIFSKTTGTQISIICPDPYFYSVYKQTTIFSGVSSRFEFPFSNESLTEDLIELGQINILKERTIYYTGDSDTGIVMKMHAVGLVEGLVIYNVGTRQTMSIDNAKLNLVTGSSIINGDDIEISTLKGDKHVLLYRDGAEINILNCLGQNSSWFELSRGDSIFTFSADVGPENLQFQIENPTKYGGV